VQQANLDQGWQISSPPILPKMLDGMSGRSKKGSWWVTMSRILLKVVVNVIANGIMQHPKVPQDSRSISSETTTFFRAQGVLVTLELPLPSNGDVSRTANLPQLTGIEFDSDFLIRQMADRIGLHPGFGPSPSVDMLIRELAQRASSLQAMLPLKAPLKAHEWNSFPQSWFVPGN
jgi:hypothetical protein